MHTLTSYSERTVLLSVKKLLDLLNRTYNCAGNANLEIAVKNMSKFRVSILITGMLVIVVAASLLTVLALYITGAVVTERTELTFAVHDEEKVYDGTPLLPAQYELVSGEIQRGHHAEVEFSGSQTDAGESKSSLSIRICDEKGYDVTGEYKIGVNSGLLKVLPKDISVTLNDEEVTYNGTKVSFENYTITEGELVTGHKIAGSQNVQLITVNDTLPSDLKPVVFDALGKDVTKNYNVHFTIGEIRVVPRPVTVKPVDKIKVYDGEEITLSEVEIVSGSLADGQYFKEIEINYGDTRFIDVSDSGATRITKISIYQMVGSKEMDVTENYDLDYLSETGIVRIEKRKLTITAKSHSWEYDGTEHSLTSDHTPLSCEGLAPGEQLLSIDYPNSIKDAGEAANTIANIRLSNNADNYEITTIAGTLTVLKREVTIITPTVSKAYDGQPLKGASENNRPTGINLAPNQKIWYDDENLISLTDHGTIRNQIECKIIDEFDGTNTDLSVNYNISYFYGEITVSKRTVRVTTPSYSKVFDGVTLYGYEEISEIYADNLVGGHSLVAPTDDDRPHVTDVDRILNTFKVSVYDGEVNVTDNYDILYTYGALEITRLNITVKTGSETREYNGKELQKSEDSTDFGYIPEGLNAVTVEDYPKITDVSRKENRVTYKLVNDGEDVNEKNYRFEYTYGYIEVTPYNFNLYLKDYDRIYNDVPFVIDNNDALDGNSFPDFLTEEAFVLVPSRDEIKNAGSYSYKAMLAEGYNPSNFNLKITGGAINIEKCGVNVKLRDYEIMYSGMVQTPEAQDVITLSGVDDSTVDHLNTDMFRIVTDGVVKNAATYTYTVKFIDGSYERNHILYISGGNITISKCPININLPQNESKTYNGQSQLPSAEQVMGTALLPNGLTYADFKTVSESGNVINASVNPYYYTVQMINSREAENYEITVTGGSLTIEKCNVMVTLRDYNEQYNAEERKPSLADADVACDIPELISNYNLAKYFELYVPEIIKDAKTYTYGIRFIYREDFENFNLTIGNAAGGGTYVVNKVAVRLESSVANQSKTYDGKVFTVDTAGAIKNGRISLSAIGTAITFNYTFSAICETADASVNTYNAGYTNLHVYNDYGEDITRNFQITNTATVRVTINPRDITFTLDNYSCTSDNVPYSGSADLLKCLGISSATPLLSGYYLNLEDFRVLVYGNVLTAYADDIRICDEKGEDVTDNFNVTNEIALTSYIIINN